jgi:hypothetical protein
MVVIARILGLVLFGLALAGCDKCGNGVTFNVPHVCKDDTSGAR